MFDYLIVTDATCDLSKSYADEHDLHILPMAYLIDGEEPEADITLHAFYDRMRAGCVTTTSQITPAQFVTHFSALIDRYGQDILYLGFSSGLSGTVAAAVIASDMMKTSHPNRRIFVADSFGATLGEGLFVHEVLRRRAEGMDIVQAHSWAMRRSQTILSYFTVDDLHFLHRGGRVSKATAIVGTALGVKPLLHINETGRLVSIGKTRGRKSSLDWLVRKMEEKTGDAVQNDICFIGHGDCPEDAQYVAAEIKKRLGVKNFHIDYIGPIVGAHAGPGTVALFFLGPDRIEAAK